MKETYNWLMQPTETPLSESLTEIRKDTMSNQSPTDALLSYEIDDESPSYATITAIAAVSDTPISELDPLIRTIDPDALDKLIDESPEVTITFQYEDYDVTVRPEKVLVRE